ncbi:chitinase [Purpureocillium lilacinum]|uniref:chitinase n=1 Tax=Purpureocillium lilacinum TaxID=33203 RepID=A0A179F0Z2_PURLI|nr:chitinase [Purpureocillium lilacinum]OAQ59091.1 chitinase [Purpureocillium lilacinum]
MVPYEIPAGVYTHINFAFGSISPQTFQVIPSSTLDEDLWRKIKTVRYRDVGVKIWLAIGGWTFNDADQPTHMIFSDIAASTGKQDAFFASLVSVMQTYGFDGIDIDWEYPRAPDRSGRVEDYQNFPKMMSRLRSALKNANTEYGISITIPISYWYLQHFDIKSLQRSVDWFNVMSYDLHGAWDLSTDYGKEHGAFVNAHTNLTEIRDSLDLLWRNSIHPSMVTLGLAFYGRTATLASSRCTTPGCQFLSPGLSGKCSGEAGVLLKTEIDDIIDEYGLTPTLDTAAAVKMISWSGNQWVSFDDGDTFKIKGDFAKSQCLGGVMVWAISHDNTQGTMALALNQALGRKSVSLPGGHGVNVALRLTGAEENQKNFCRWSNCGADCPYGFSEIVQSDGSDKIMQDKQDCYTGARKLCCPKSQSLPKCRWRGYHSSGTCKPGCESKEVEIGTLREGCTQSGYQSACCEGSKSTEPYGQCKWVGDYPNCSPKDKSNNCPEDYPHGVVVTDLGSGGMPACQQGSRSLCCKGSDVPAPFQGCLWQRNFFNNLPSTNELCDDSCPDGQIRIARLACMKGSFGYCCAGSDTYDDSNEKRSLPASISEKLERDLDRFLADPTCPNYRGPLRRATLASRAMSYSDFYIMAEMIAAAIVQPKDNYYMFQALKRGLEDDDAYPSAESLSAYAASMTSSYSGNNWDVVGWVEYMLCNPGDAKTGMDRQNQAGAQTCSRPSQASGSASRLRRHGSRHYELLEGDVGSHATTQTTDSKYDALLEFAKRRFVPKTDGLETASGEPTVIRAMQGVLDGDLTLHYGRWLRYAPAGGRRFALELAFWIGPSLFNAPSQEIARRYRNPAYPNRPPRWVVFHIHFEADSIRVENAASASDPTNAELEQVRMFLRIPGTTGSSRYRAGATVVNVFHSDRVTPFMQDSNGFDHESRVEYADNSRFGYNSRATILSCPADSRWYIGTPPPENANLLERTLGQFGELLYNRHYADMWRFAYIYHNEADKDTADGRAMNRRRLTPDNYWFGGNFDGDGWSERGMPEESRVPRTEAADPDFPMDPDTNY